MSDIEKKNQGELIGFLHGKGGELDIPVPFERDIFLFDTYIAGTSFVEGIEDLEPHIRLGDRVNFLREPDNPYDKDAILIKNEGGVKLGYIPKKDNPVFARLMDAGKVLFGKIKDKNYEGDWLHIDVEIYLHD